MTVPVVGSLLTCLITGLVLPHKLRVQPCQLLKQWEVKPRLGFLTRNSDAVGLCGMSLKTPLENRLCDSCGGELQDFFFLWRASPNSDQASLYAVHPGCVIGYSSLYGADSRTRAALRELWDRFGAKLGGHSPAAASSLREKLDSMEGLVREAHIVKRALKSPYLSFAKRSCTRNDES